jgi:uncharacterized membrane protein (UPF0127 family)
MSRRLERLPRVRAALAGWEIRLAARPCDRLLGLSWLPAPAPRTALLLPRTRSVHTFGMRFALDLLWLDATGRIVRIDRTVGRRRVIGCREAVAVAEARAGSGRALGTGDRLVDP